jgi:tetratricopeptide (TPR) repeat protein
MGAHRFPDEYSLGTLYRSTSSPDIWQRWLPAQGPVVLWPPAVALRANPAVVGGLAQLPDRLAGLSLYGVPIDDAGAQEATRRLRHLRWLDLRETDVTPEGFRSLRRRKSLRAVAMEGDTPLVRFHDPTPSASAFALGELLAHVSWGTAFASPEAAVSAVTRAEALIDVGRPRDAVAVLAPYVHVATEDVAVTFATAAWKLRQPGAALAALHQVDATPRVLVVHASIVAGACPDAALELLGAALREDPLSYLAHWYRGSVLLGAGQPELAERALADVEKIDAGHVDTLRLQGFVHNARGRRDEAVDSWRRVLAQRPDDAEALTQLSVAQRRRTRPWALEWTESLQAASEADAAVAVQLRLPEQVTAHRRGLARAFAAVGGFAVLWAGTHVSWFYGKSGGIFVVAGVAILLAVSSGLWLLTPAPVRRTIRRSDELLGSHRGPDWRRAGVAVAAAVVCFFTFGDFEPTPECGPGSGGARHGPTPCPQVPEIHIPTFPPVPTFPGVPTFPAVPTFPSVPTLSGVPEQPGTG